MNYPDQNESSASNPSARGNRSRIQSQKAGNSGSIASIVSAKVSGGNEYDGETVLGMMTKYWHAGQVKTRLGEWIGMREAAALHRLFTLHLCENLKASAHRRQLCIAPASRISTVGEELARLQLTASWQLVPQSEGDLGQRMLAWLAAQLRGGDGRAVLIGADCPTLLPDDVNQATGLLDTHDLVLGPAADGGYYLIGLRGPWNDRFAALFADVPWSSSAVLKATMERAAAACLSVAQLPEREDIDTVVELEQLIVSLAREGQSHHRTLSQEIEHILKSTSHPSPSKQS